MEPAIVNNGSVSMPTLPRPINNADAEKPAAPAQPENPGTAVAEKPAPASPKPKHLPPYRVLLHNDDEHDMLFVVASIMELTPLDKQRSMLVMLEAHTAGCALVLVTHKERAELYQEQFHSKGLTVTIEPAES